MKNPKSEIPNPKSKSPPSACPYCGAHGVDLVLDVGLFGLRVACYSCKMAGPAVGPTETRAATAAWNRLPRGPKPAHRKGPADED